MRGIKRDSKGRFVKGHKMPLFWFKKLQENAIYYKKGNKINNGRVHSLESREHFRQAQFRRYHKSQSHVYNGIRHLCRAKEFVIGVYRRDHFTCRKCHVKCRHLIAHHLKAFGLIFKEFLENYNQFSWYEDKETLIRLALSYEPFWEVSNGGTLCVPCHNEFHLIYGRKGDNTVEQWDEFIQMEIKR